MAESKEGVDDMIVHLMSMGFEIQECQDAISFGKTTVESAVEWLVSGKPGFKQNAKPVDSGPSLKLRGTTSNFETSGVPFVKPNPVPQDVQASSSSQSQAPPAVVQSETSSAEMDQSESQVVSRMHLNDTQRKQKDSFEQKKRDEARKQALLEKRRQKEEHARVLKEIAADREMKKMFKPCSQTEAGAQPELESPTKPKEQKVETESQPSVSASCLLQIRLPDGRSLRQSFSATARLQEVWDFTAKTHSNMTGYRFIQPFPHHEFTAAEMGHSLCDLKLTPTGSLVLQKKQISQAVDEKTESHELMNEEVTPPSPVREPDTCHRWGQGHALDTESAGQDIPGGMEIEQAIDEAMQEGDEEEAEEGEPEMVMPGMFGGHGIPGMGPGGHGIPGMVPGGHGMPGMGPGGHGIPGMGPGGHAIPGMANMGQNLAGMMGFGGHQQAFGGVGNRLVAEGDPANDNLAAQQKSRTARDLAFERAQARLVQVQDNVPTQSTSAQTLHHSPTLVNSLLLHCLKHISHRLNDPRHQILSLSGVSEDMAQVILQHLIKEKQLKPQTLKAFVPCYLRKLVLDCYPYTTNELLHMVRLHANLSSVSLTSCPLITDAGLQSLNSLKKLKKLCLNGCKQITNKGIEVCSNMPGLVSLNLEETGVTDAGVIQYLGSQPACLQHLNVNRTSITHAIIPHLCTRAKQLRSLSIEDTKVVSLSGIQEIEHLEMLNVARTRVVPESLLCIASCHRLKSLNLANTENLNGDDALKHIQGLQLHNLTLPSRHTTTNLGIQYLSGFPLVALDLTNFIFVGDEAMEHIGKIQSLKKLLLSNTKLTDSGIVFLEGLQQLEELNIDRTLVTDTGANIVKALVSLVELSMASTGVTSKFLLSGSLNACTNLVKLNISKTMVTSKGIMSITLPFLQLLCLDGTKVSPGLTVSMVTGCPKLSQMPARNLQPFTRDDEVAEAEMEVDNA